MENLSRVHSWDLYPGDPKACLGNHHTPLPPREMPLAGTLVASVETTRQLPWYARGASGTLQASPAVPEALGFWQQEPRAAPSCHFGLKPSGVVGGAPQLEPQFLTFII